jgi:predicted RecB family nuclease
MFIDYLCCNYKAYLKINGLVGKKSDYEILQNKLFNEYRSSAANFIRFKWANEEILEDSSLIQFVESNNKLGINIRVEFDNFDVIFDGITKGLKPKNDFVPIAFLNKKKITIDDKLHLAFCGFALGSKLKRMPSFGRIIYGTDYSNSRVKLDKFILRINPNIEVIKSFISSKDPPQLFINKHCQICEFSKYCLEKAKQKDDLSLLKTLSEKEIKKLNNKGIFTLRQFSFTFRPRKIRKKSKFSKKIRHHSLQALAIRENKIFVFDKFKLELKPLQIYFDIEGIPDENYAYLIGLVIIDNKNGRAFNYNQNLRKRYYWGDSSVDELRIFKKFIQTISKYDDYQLFHYGSYETKLLKRIKKETNDSNVALLDEILNNSINVTTLIYENIYFPTYSNELKEIGRYLGCKWKSPDASGIQSIYWRKKWEMTRDDKWKKMLISYNQEDCLNLAIVVNKILHILNKAGIKENSDVIFAKNLKQRLITQNYHSDNFYSETYEYISKAAYFDYQREKVFIRTNPSLGRYRKAKKKKNYLRTNKYIPLRVRKCPFCKNFGLKIQPGARWYKYALDLKFTGGGVKKWKISYYSEKYLCPKCDKSFYAPKLKKAKYHYLYNLKAWVVYHYVVSKLSFERIAQYTNDLFGYNIGFGRVISMKKEMARYYKITHKKILNSICSGNTIHVDETPIQLRDRRAYVWVLTSMEEVYYVFQESREVSFLKTLLKDYSGVIISDFYPGYDGLVCRQQKCLVHLIRDLNDDLYKHPYDSELKNLINTFSTLLKPAFDSHRFTKTDIHNNNRM